MSLIRPHARAPGKQIGGLLLTLTVLLIAGCSQVEAPGSAAATSAPATTALVSPPTTSASSTTVSKPDEASTEAGEADSTSSSDSDSSGTDSESTDSGSTGTGGTSSGGTDADAEEETADTPSVEGELQLQLVNSYPHDPAAFTQGLAFWGGHLIESTGLYGESDIRRYSTGPDEFSEDQSLEDSLFGSGLAIVDNKIIQLTWRAGEALVRDPDTLDQTDFFTYAGEGWGLCYDGQQLIMGDGSDQLVFRDPETFQATGSISVTRDGAPVIYLNELECVNGLIWANVWLSNEIVAIDPGTSEVVAWVDASSIVPDGLAADDVLNGIAYASATDTWFLTGKHWDTIFEVRFAS